MLIYKSEFMDGYVLRGKDKAEFIPRHVAGEMPTGKVEAMDSVEKKKTTELLDFSLEFHKVNDIESVSPVEGYFGVLTVGPYLDKETAMNKLSSIELEESFDEDSLEEFIEEDLSEEVEYDGDDIDEFDEDEDEESGYINEEFEEDIVDEDNYEKELEDDLEEEDI